MELTRPDLCDACDCLIEEGQMAFHWHQDGKSWNMHRECHEIYSDEVYLEELAALPPSTLRGITDENWELVKLWGSLQGLAFTREELERLPYPRTTDTIRAYLKERDAPQA